MNDPRGPAHVHVIGRGSEAVLELSLPAGPVELRATMASPTSGPPTAKWTKVDQWRELNEAGLPPAITAGNSNVAGESGEYSALGQLKRIVSGAYELHYNFNDTANDGRVVSEEPYLGSSAETVSYRFNGLWDYLPVKRPRTFRMGSSMIVSEE